MPVRQKIFGMLLKWEGLRGLLLLHAGAPFAYLAPRGYGYLRSAMSVRRKHIESDTEAHGRHAVREAIRSRRVVIDALYWP